VKVLACQEPASNKQRFSGMYTRKAPSVAKLTNFSAGMFSESLSLSKAKNKKMDISATDVF